MSKFSQKFVSVVLSAATVVSFSGALLPVASAQTTDIAALQAQIASLLAQISALQAQLGSSGGSTAGFTFTRDLTVGSRGADVTALQNILISKGFLAAGKNTGYFGALTKAALMKWQASAGISPTSGYFGPKSRAALNAMAGTPGTPGTPGVPGVPAPASGLAVSLASDNPASGSLISSASSAAARVPVMAVNLTAGTAGGVTITQLMVHKRGVLSDNAISGAYLVENGQVLAQFTALNNGAITFGGINIGVNAGQTRKLWLAIDPAVNLAAGNTVSFGFDSASDFTVVDSSNAPVTASGAFPLNGNVFTVTSVTNPSIASVTITSSSVASTVFAGTQNVLVSQWTANVSNSPVNLSSVNFKVVGSANKTDIKNVKLLINGVQVGNTLPSVGADGNAYFNLSTATGTANRLNTGTTNIQVVADIMGSPSFTFQFELLNTYDVYAIDTQYNVPVTVTINGGSGVQVTIQQGQTTVTVDTGTPTSNLAKGASGSVLAKIDIYAAGEAIKVKFLRVRFIKTGGANWTTAGNFDADLRNLQLVDDAGNQIGTTINTVGSGGTGSGQCSLDSSTQVTCNFGTSASPITYIIPANTTRVISIKADVQTGASFTTVAASLPGETSNLQGLTSNQTASSGAATGNALTLAANSLVVTQNGSVPNPTYAKSATHVKIGSYVFTASSAEGVNVSNFTISVNASSTNFQNLMAQVGTTVVGTTYPTLSGSTNYTFSGSFAVPSGGTTIVDIYADVLSTASGPMGTLTSFVSCTGTGATTFSSVSCSGTPAGQSVTIASTLTMSVSNNISLPNRQVVMGNTGVSLAKILLQDTSGIEAQRVQELKFTIQVNSSAVGAAFTNLRLYDSSGNAIPGAGPISMTSSSPIFVADFNFGGAATVEVPMAGQKALELRGDVTPFVINSNIENTTSAIKILAATDIVAFGKSSNLSVTVSGTPTFATITTLRSKLNLSGAALSTDSACPGYTGGSTSSRSRTSVDYVACIKLSADSSGQDVRVNTLTLTFSGAALLTTTTPFSVQLIDPSTQTNYDGSSAAVTCTASANSCSVTFSFTGTPISAGATKGVVVQVNSTNFNNVAQQTDGLDITLNAAGNVAWADGPSGIGATTGGLSLSSDVSIPLQLTHVDYQ